MQITRKVKEIVAKLPPECPNCRSLSGSPTLCDMCLGVRALRMALGVPEPSPYGGSYNDRGRWTIGAKAASRSDSVSHQIEIVEAPRPED